MENLPGWLAMEFESACLPVTNPKFASLPPKSQGWNFASLREDKKKFFNYFRIRA